MRPRPGFYAVLLAGNLLALGAVVAGVLLLRDSWWALLLAPVLGGGLDPARLLRPRRRRTARSPAGERPSRRLGLLAGNLLNGLSYGWWMDKHNAHHAHPNDLDPDPDVHAGALVFDAAPGGRSPRASPAGRPGTRPGCSSRC